MNIEELFDNELYHNYGMLTTEEANCLIKYLKEETMEYITELQKELAEEARLNGMGAEREAKLLARVAELEKQLKPATIQEMYELEVIKDLHPKQINEVLVAMAKQIAKLLAQIDLLQQELISVYQSIGNDLTVYQLKKLRGKA